MGPVLAAIGQAALSKLASNLFSKNQNTQATPTVNSVTNEPTTAEDLKRVK